MGDTKPERMQSLFANGSAGIITLDDQLCVASGEVYKYLWAPTWQVTSDATFPVEGFRSTEHWQAIALDEDGNTLAIVPGCQVKGWSACSCAPSTEATRLVCDLTTLVNSIPEA